MTDKEAKFLLGACPPGGEPDAEFAEALEQARRDPALGAWLADQRQFDAAIASRMRALPVPADLRERILTGARVSRRTHWYTAQRLWAIAALLMLFSGAGLWYSIEGRRNSDWQSQSLAAVSDILAGREKFDAASPRVAELEQWLRANGSPSATALPASLKGLASLGCKTLLWNGHPISIICFHGPGGELVHLAMVDRNALESPPPEGHPIYGTRDGWRMACWSQEGMAMMLVTRAPEEQLRAFFAMVF